MIELQQISVSLPPDKPHSKPILSDIDLVFRDGEWVSIVGPNGSGKTTLLASIAGVMPVSSGRVRVRTPGGHEPASKPRIGLLLQEPDNQFVASTVRHEMLLSLPEGLDEETGATRLAQAGEQFSLTGMLERNPHRLSGGEKQRLALASVWLADPEILLLDEPTSYLDRVERGRCERFVREQNEQGVTIIWATLGGDDARLASRVVYLDMGRVRYDGPATGLFEKAQQRGFDVDPVVPPRNDDEEAGGGASWRHGAGGPFIEMRHVDFSYGDTPVFHDLSLQVFEGEILGIVGRNGTGKSTLLNLMGGILEPATGAVVRRYRKPVEGATQNVFYLFQTPERLFFAETVFEEVSFGLKSLGTPDAEIGARIEEALDRVGLPPKEFATRSPFSLSLGEMRRLAFAMTIALRPRLLLLDEPTSCLDGQGRRLLRGLVKDLRQSGGAVVVASHDMELLRGVADRRIELGS